MTHQESPKTSTCASERRAAKIWATSPLVYCLLPWLTGGGPPAKVGALPAQLLVLWRMCLQMQTHPWQLDCCNLSQRMTATLNLAKVT